MSDKITAAAGEGILVSTLRVLGPGLSVVVAVVVTGDQIQPSPALMLSCC